jgi:SAM-dependent methyltransferase
VTPFDHDVSRSGGYVYTTDAPLSARLANRRLTVAALSVADFKEKRVLDIGCGDGTYTLELVDVAGAASVQGIDPAGEAIRVARERVGDRPIAFSEGSAYELPHEADAFDLACLRGVLHHLERPAEALREALRVAPWVVGVEPNGYNPGLKVLERCSTYHVEHGERSFTARTLDGWVKAAGARIEARTFAGFVPMFSPDWLARAMKRIEPAVEALPGVRTVGCAVYVFAAAR